jgi:RimJ/RimL family protein N-acetyltransferase
MTDWTPAAIGRHKFVDARVELRPLTEADTEQLRDIAFDADIWRYFVALVANDADLDRFVQQAETDTRNGSRVVFAIIDRASGRVAGSTAFGNLVEAERRLEIGWSWLGKEFQGTGINRSTKKLLLTYAFEALGCERVEFKTDALNLQARAGLRAIGATEEGILRSFNFMPGGRRRNAVYYSILKDEWPALKERQGHG